MNNEKFLLEAEKRFKKTAKLAQDFSLFPLSENISNIDTNKEKSKEFSEVFTPLWLVDQMIGQVKFSGANTKTLDLCAGYGQFSIRLMRYFYETYPDFDVSKFIKENHAFSELQLSSCYKLLNIFGNKITLFIGDSTHLNKLPPDAKGLWCYIENYGYWVCLTKTISAILSPNGIKEKQASEAQFVSSIESIVKELNETHIKIKDMHNFTADQIKKRPELRLEFIHYINRDTKDSSLQSVDTPQNIVSDMLDQVDDLEKKTILVLFNLEIVEQLIHKNKIDPKNITFGIEHASDLKALAAQKIYGIDLIKMSSSPAFLYTSFKGRKFDVCLSNPPYNRGLDLKILLALIGKGTIDNSIAKEYIFVHPSTWLLDQKNIFPLYTNTKSALLKKLKSVKFFNGYSVFNCEGLDICTITHVDIANVLSKTKVSFMDNINDDFEVDDINDITKFGKSWLSIVKSFSIKMNKVISTYTSVWSHNTKAPDKNKFYCQLAAIIGHTSKDSSSRVKEDFYTLTMKDTSEENKGIRQPNLNRPGNPTPTFQFNSEIERDNFLSYLNTDFARFCFALLKAGKNAATGEMELIPWLDFTQSWDDDKLFKHFGIDQTTQDYIRKFLPDYYGIRKNH